MKTLPLYLFFALILFTALPACSQTTGDPFSDPIETEEGLVVVNVTEFAAVPDADGEPARMMLLNDEPGTRQLFVNDMRGPLYRVSYDGSDVALYVNINDPEWGVGVESGGRETGFQSFAFHPDFGKEGAPGYGRFYTWSDVTDTGSEADFRPNGGGNTHHTVLHEWQANDPAVNTYDGDPPRELIRLEQPYGNHNAGLIAFNPTAEEGDEEYGLLYIGSADGGSGGDPLNLAQDRSSPFGKMLRIDPLGSNSSNGQYGIPPDNPFVDADDTFNEIYALGMRNPQRFGWDPENGNLFMADIGQGTVEKISLVPAGGNLGWNEWEGSYRFAGRSEVDASDPRSDPDITYPVVEYSRTDPLMHRRAAATGVVVHRSNRIPQLSDRVLFGDLVSGEMLHFSADDLPEGGTEGIRRILLRDSEGDTFTLLELIQEKNRQQDRQPAQRADLRYGNGPEGRIFLLNKHDGTIRELMP